MEDQQVTPETAELARKLGFLADNFWDGLSQTSLQKWLREEKKQYFTVLPWEGEETMKYIYRVWDHFPITDLYKVDIGFFDTWEQAMEAGLQYCLKVLIEMK